MKTYKNVTGLNREDLDENSLLYAVKEQLEDSYPNLMGDNLTIVADLMVRFDEDVTEENGQFNCYSTEDSKTYDIHFNSDESSDNLGFTASLENCKDYIEMHNGTNHSYFEDYKGGMVSIVCKQTEETVFETEVQ